MKGAEYMDAMIAAVMNELKVCLICRIESIDSNSRTQLKPLHKYFFEGEYVDIPTLVSVPMMQLGTEDFLIQMPFKPGDIVPVVIADYDIENIVISGNNTNPNVDDTHNINDAIALPVVLNPFNNQLPSNPDKDLIIRKRTGVTKMVFKADSEEVIIESNTIKLGENASQGVKLGDDSTSTKVLAE